MVTCNYIELSGSDSETPGRSTAGGKWNASRASAGVPHIWRLAHFTSAIQVKDGFSLFNT